MSFKCCVFWCEKLYILFEKIWKWQLLLLEGNNKEKLTIKVKLMIIKLRWFWSSRQIIFQSIFWIISYLFLFLHLGIVVVKNRKEMDKGKNRAGGGKCLRTCASIVFSTIGVGAILISYIFCGAILFLTLEGNNGKQ